MSRLPALLCRLSRDRRGAATIEFALWSMLFFMGMLTALDFAMWRTQQLRLGSAIEQGGMLAFNQRTTLGNPEAGNIKTYIEAAAQVAGSAAPVVTYKCNGATACPAPASRQCACLSTNAAGQNSYAPLACAATCPGSQTTSGFYLEFAASNTYRSAVLPRDLLSGRTMANSVVVRLQ